jgi:hypothetical protein
MIEGEIELVAMVARFRGLVADWQLSPADVAALLQVDREQLGLDLLPPVTAPVEHRMRLMLEIAIMAPVITGDATPRDWLHANDLPYDPERTTPLEFLSGPLSNLRALRSLLCQYA